MWKILFGILSVATLFISPDCGGGKAVKVADLWAVEGSFADPNQPEGAAERAADVYLTISNTASETDKLVSVTTPAADIAQIVETVMKDGSMLPQPIGGVDIKGDHDLIMKPHKTYILLRNLKQPLVEGASFPITLGFQNAGEIKQSVLVEKKGSVKYTN